MFLISGWTLKPSIYDRAQASLSTPLLARRSLPIAPLSTLSPLDLGQRPHSSRQRLAQLFLRATRTRVSCCAQVRAPARGRERAAAGEGGDLARATREGVGQRVDAVGGAEAAGAGEGGHGGVLLWKRLFSKGLNGGERPGSALGTIMQLMATSSFTRLG